jgi:hypothetical protein
VLPDAPNSIKQTWTENGFRYEVGIHPGENQYTNAQSIYRVSRQEMPTPGAQGSGRYYLGTGIMKVFLRNSLEMVVGIRTSISMPRETPILIHLE